MSQPVPQIQQAQAQGPSLAAPSLASTDTVFSVAHQPWTYMVNPAKLTTYKGHIVASLSKALHEPGACGNDPGPNRGEGMAAWMERPNQGFTRLPHDMQGLVAFGKSRDGAAVSTYLEAHHGVGTEGQPVVHYTSAWHRPRRLGHTTRWDFDEEGWIRFLGSALALVQDGEPLSDDQVQIAIEPRLRAIRNLLDKIEGPLRSRLLHQHAAHLPEQYHPVDFRAVLGLPTKGGAKKR